MWQNLVVLLFIVGLTLGAEEKEVKYQLANKKVVIADRPTNTSEIKTETLQLITIANSASYGVQNPDFGILSVTIKSYYKESETKTDDATTDDAETDDAKTDETKTDDTKTDDSTTDDAKTEENKDRRKKRDTKTPPLYTQLLLVNDDLSPVTEINIANSTSSKSFGCPTSNSSTVPAATSSYAFLAYLSSSWASTVELTVNLDFTKIAMGNSIKSVLDHSQKEVLHMVDITPDHVSYRKSVHINVESENEMNATLYISPYCPAAVTNFFEGYERAKLSFSKTGTFSLHHSSFPVIKAQRYYVRISLADGYPANMSKNVTVSVNQGYDYTVFVPLSLYCLVCLFFATMITWGFFRVFSYSCDLPCYASWRKTIMGWLIRGNKGYAYWTLVVGVCILLGEVAVVIKSYDRMTTEGDRDLCYYNEKCYRSVTWMDMPANSVTSNLSFLLHGIMALIVISLMESKCGENNHIHEHSFSLAYSLGTAHVMQALCAGLYSLCPSRLSQTYDLTFLYITIALYVACLFDRGSINYIKDQKLSRFCSIPSKPVRASKFYVFLVGPMLALQYTEAAFTSEGWPSNVVKTVYYAVFFVWLATVHAWIAFKAELFPMDFYRWLTDGRCDPDHPEFCNWWDCYSYKMKRDSGYGWKMMLFVLHTLISIAFAGYEGFFCDDCNFSYFFLGWLLSGLIFCLLYALFDQIGLENKFAHSSWHTNFTWIRIIYSLMVLTAWAATIWIYRKYDLYNPLRSPQESRTMNDQCIFFDYYDGNDMFSMLSSFAMLGTTYLVIYLNYPCVECVSAHYGIEYTGRRFSMSLSEGAKDKPAGGAAPATIQGPCGHSGCGGSCSHGAGKGGPLNCGCKDNCGCAKKSCGCSIKSICDCKQREASKRGSCKGGCPHSKSGFSRNDSHRHTKESVMTDMSDDISYINISDDVPDPHIIFKENDTSKYPAVVVKSGEKKGKPGYLF